MDTRRLLTGLLLALAVFLIARQILLWVEPERPTATQPAVVHAPAPPPTTQIATGTRPSETAPGLEPAPRRELRFIPAQDRTPVTLGGESDDVLELTLTPCGAGVQRIRLTERDPRKDRYVHRAEADGDQPYEILDPVIAVDAGFVSFTTYKIEIQEYNNDSWSLERLVWSIDESASSDRRVVFTTSLQATENAEEILRLTKTFELQAGKPLVNLGLSVENTSGETLTVIVYQDGPVGIRRESPMYEMRRVLVAHNVSGTIKTSETEQRGGLKKAAPETVELFSAARGGSFAWTGLTNRFFGVLTRSLPVEESAGPLLVSSVKGTVALPDSDAKLGDLISRMISAPLALAPGERGQQAFEIYIGPKDPELLEAVNPDFVDSTKVYYNLAQAADRRCCTFEPLPQIMVWLLHTIQSVVRNHGIAIIILVIIVRTLLHPLTVYQQKSMYKMQEGMSRLQPKMQEIKERYANDKARQNKELMKLYADEGVNPMGSLVGMLPLFIQMPILVALWTGLNTDIQLRHAPFDGWWITDLASPDALYMFSAPITIPILGQLPFIGPMMFTDIPSFNLLPLLMGVSMWLQQKYMPKPGMQAKVEAAKKNPPQQRKPGQTTPQDQLRQQQMMAYMMSIMFPLMFYYMPAGLNLYWMATNVFGIGESLVIRKQLKQAKERRAQQGPQPKRKKAPGVFGRIMKRMAEQADHVQRKADKLAEHDPSGKARRDRKDNDKGRKNP